MSSHLPENDSFQTTRWSLVVSAGQREQPASEQALESLCSTYWYPLYAFIRRRGYQPAEAQDLTQGFFERMLEKEYLQAADQEKGRFRVFLLTVFKRYVSNEQQQQRAAKRGGDRRLLSLDFEKGERWLSSEPTEPETPEHVFERRWALTLLERVLQHLRESYVKRGKQAQFDELSVFLTAAGSEDSYQVVAEKLGMTPGAVKVAIHRLRQRYRDQLRSEVADTVADEDQIDQELQELLNAVRGSG